MRTPNFRQRAFNDLRTLLYRWSPPMDVVTDEPDHYVLVTRHIQKNKKPLNFGAVRISKTYVSFHFKPMFLNPSLIADISPALKKHQQGKGCFNFKAPDARLFAELKELVKQGYQDFVRRGYL